MFRSSHLIATIGLLAVTTAPAALAAEKATQAQIAKFRLEHDSGRLARISDIASKIEFNVLGSTPTTKFFCENIIANYSATGALAGALESILDEATRGLIASEVAKVNDLISSAKSDICDSFYARDSVTAEAVRGIYHAIDDLQSKESYLHALLYAQYVQIQIVEQDDADRIRAAETKGIEDSLRIVKAVATPAVGADDSTNEGGSGQKKVE